MNFWRRSRSQRGQSVVEFALILPVIMFLMLGMIELGFAINHNTSLVTATREGARVGSELVDGGNRKGLTPITAASQAVDPQIIAATEGVLRSPGSPVSVAQVTSIVIFETDETGAATTKWNTWVKAINPDGTPNGAFIPGTTTHLYFSFSTGNWDASIRSGASPAHGIGVRINYTYQFITPLGSLIKAVGGTLFGTGQIMMSDQTIMAMEPPTP
jgi:Flp pilus assembly protein TadG